MVLYEAAIVFVLFVFIWIFILCVCMLFSFSLHLLFYAQDCIRIFCASILCFPTQLSVVVLTVLAQFCWCYYRMSLFFSFSFFWCFFFLVRLANGNKMLSFRQTVSNPVLLSYARLSLLGYLSCRRSRIEGVVITWKI